MILVASVNESVYVLLVKINYLRCMTVCFIKVIAILESSRTDEQILFVAICTLKPGAVCTVVHSLILLIPTTLRQNMYFVSK